MSRYAFVGIFVLVVLAGASAVGWTIFNRGADEPAQLDATPDTPAADDALVSIKAVMEHPETYGDLVRLEGVVAQVDGDRGLFMLMSRQDWMTCGKSNCCVPLMLPVRGVGELPMKESVVRVEGRVEQTDGRYVLAVESVERLES